MLRYDSIFPLSGPAAFVRGAFRRLAVGTVCASLTLSLAACGTASAVAASDVATAEATTATSTTAADGTDAYAVAATFTEDVSSLFSERDRDASFDEASAVRVTLADSGSSSSGAGVTVSGSAVTISEEGTYVLTGTLTDGRIVVDAPDDAKVQIVLAGASVTSTSPAALVVENADKVFLTLGSGTANVLAATGEDVEEDGHTLDGTVFSTTDLTVNGAGTLSVSSGAGAGIVGKDELTICGPTLTVEAATHALQAKDSLAIESGTLTLTAGKDGIHVAHDEDADKGFCYVAGGTLDIHAASDGIDATNDVIVDGGTLTIRAGDDGIHADYDLVVNAGTIDVRTSVEGLEGARVTQMGGSVTINATDDGVNASGDPTADDANDGAAQDAQGEARRETTAQEAPTDASGQDVASGTGQRMGGMPDGGTMPEMPQMPEEGEMPQMPEGSEMPQMGERPDAGDAPTSGGFGAHMGGMFDADETASITVRGGTLTVSAQGDGLDSNGTIEIAGGEVYVSGPVSDGNGALDYGLDAKVTGGIVVAAGSAGMAVGFGEDSTQGWMLVSAQGAAGDAVTLTDEAGSVLATFTPASSYACVLVSAPSVTDGGTYTLACGTTSTQVTMEGLSYSNLTRTQGTDAGGQGWGRPQDQMRGQGMGTDGQGLPEAPGGASAAPDGAPEMAPGTAETREA